MPNAARALIVPIDRAKASLADLAQASIRRASDRSTEPWNHLHRQAPGRRRHHDHGRNAAERGERKPLDHLLVGDDLLRAREQEAINASDPERVFEGDLFPPRADCHVRLPFSNLPRVRGSLCPFRLISYLFLCWLGTIVRPRYVLALAIRRRSA
jgi:hypothetical protein